MPTTQDIKKSNTISDTKSNTSSVSSYEMWRTLLNNSNIIAVKGSRLIQENMSDKLGIPQGSFKAYPTSEFADVLEVAKNSSSPALNKLLLFMYHLAKLNQQNSELNTILNPTTLIIDDNSHMTRNIGTLEKLAKQHGLTPPKLKSLAKLSEETTLDERLIESRVTEERVNGFIKATIKHLLIASNELDFKNPLIKDTHHFLDNYSQYRDAVYNEIRNETVAETRFRPQTSGVETPDEKPGIEIETAFQKLLAQQKNSPSLSVMNLEKYKKIITDQKNPLSQLILNLVNNVLIMKNDYEKTKSFFSRKSLKLDPLMSTLNQLIESRGKNLTNENAKIIVTNIIRKLIKIKQDTITEHAGSSPSLLVPQIDNLLNKYPEITKALQVPEVKSIAKASAACTTRDPSHERRLNSLAMAKTVQQPSHHRPAPSLPAELNEITSPKLGKR